jgi:hypothetical protein
MYIYHQLVFTPLVTELLPILILKFFHPPSPFTLASLRSPLLLSIATSPLLSSRPHLASRRVSPSPQAHGIFEREEASTASPTSPLLSSRPHLALSLASRRVSPSPQQQQHASGSTSTSSMPGAGAAPALALATAAAAPKQ